MTTPIAHRLTTLDTNAQQPAYSESGTGGDRWLEIGLGPVSVLLTVANKEVQLQDQVWEYAFTGDGSLELFFKSTDPICGHVRLPGETTMTALTGIDGTLHFSCPRPQSDDADEQYEFVFTRDTTSPTPTSSVSLPRDPRERPTLPPQASGKPEGPTDIQSTSAQPTLIIRTKRSCPTGPIKPAWVM